MNENMAALHNFVEAHQNWIPTIDYHPHFEEPKTVDLQVRRAIETNMGTWVCGFKVFGIIHGIGTGVLKERVENLIKEYKRRQIVRDHFWLDNPGVVFVVINKQDDAD